MNAELQRGKNGLVEERINMLSDIFQEKLQVKYRNFNNNNKRPWVTITLDRKHCKAKSEEVAESQKQVTHGRSA